MFERYEMEICVWKINTVGEGANYLRLWFLSYVKRGLGGILEFGERNRYREKLDYTLQSLHHVNALESYLGCNQSIHSLVRSA